MVLESVKVDVEKITTMAQFWEFMDVEFGNKNKLVCDRLAYLKNYKHPEQARTDAQKFQGMYTRFNEVYSDMEKVDSLNLLEHPASIQEFMKLLPDRCLDKYVEYQLAEQKKGTLNLEIVKSFMQEERKHQKAMQQLRGEEASRVSGHSTDNHSPPPIGGE